MQIRSIIMNFNSENMDRMEEILKSELNIKVDSSFTEETMSFIRKKERTKRIALGSLLFLIATIVLPFIPFESLTIENIPYLGVPVVINKIYVFIAFTFTIVLFFDTLFRSFFSSNHTNYTTK